MSLLLSELGIRIRIRRIRICLGLPDPDLDPLVRGADPDPDPFLFLIDVLSGLKECLQKRIIPQFSAKKSIFRLKMMCLLATYNIKEENFFGILKDPELEPDPDP
jgi:hypothetical protein